MILQALEIIFEMQRKRNNEKITRREINLPTYKTQKKNSLWTPFTFRTS